MLMPAPGIERLRRLRGLHQVAVEKLHARINKLVAPGPTGRLKVDRIGVAYSAADAARTCERIASAIELTHGRQGAAVHGRLQLAADDEETAKIQGQAHKSQKKKQAQGHGHSDRPLLPAKAD
jgi:hypothetical protein